jgi:hypothetical protein
MVIGAVSTHHFRLADHPKTGACKLRFTDAETLTITVPTTTWGLKDLVLSNPDGTTYTLETAVAVQ